MSGAERSSRNAGERFVATLRDSLQHHDGIGYITVQTQRDDGGLHCAQADDGTL